MCTLITVFIGLLIVFYILVGIQFEMNLHDKEYSDEHRIVINVLIFIFLPILIILKCFRLVDRVVADIDEWLK